MLYSVQSLNFIILVTTITMEVSMDITILHMKKLMLGVKYNDLPKGAPLASLRPETETQGSLVPSLYINRYTKLLSKNILPVWKYLKEERKTGRMKQKNKERKKWEHFLFMHRMWTMVGRKEGWLFRTVQT